MPEIDDVCRQLWEATEFVAIVTQGPEGPHVVGNWGDYVRKLGLRDGCHAGGEISPDRGEFTA